VIVSVVQRPSSIEETRLAAESLDVPIETEFLDLDCDGVPDAVKTTSTIAVDISHDRRVDVVETTEEIASEIDINGVPHAIRVADTVEADLGHDGFAESVDSVEYELELVDRTNAA